MKTLAYLAHPLGPDGPDRERNRVNATRWVVWCTLHLDVAVIADWIILSGELKETPQNRELGLACDIRQIQACEVLILCGGRISPGMKIESDAAISQGIYVADFTEFGYAPPLPLEEHIARAKELLVRPVRV